MLYSISIQCAFIIFALYNTVIYAHGIHYSNDTQDTNNAFEYDDTHTHILLADHLHFFNKDVHIEGPIDCKIADSKGKLFDSSCYEVSIFSITEDHPMGPWCPKTVDDIGAGFWFTGPDNIHQVDGAFFADNNPNNRAWWVWNLMEEENWEALYGWKKSGNSFLEDNDKTRIKVPNNGDDCLAEIFPSTKGGNYREYVCQECLPLNTKEWYSNDNTNHNKYVFFNADGSKKVISKRLIPATPQVGSTVTQAFDGPYHVTFNIGLTFSGLIFEGAAPITKKGGILDVKTIVPFDACGGHVNPQGGYHYHQAKHCYPIMQEDDTHTGLVGFAWDGFPIYDYEADIAGLDPCDGHVDAIRGYHYHLAEPGSNRFIGCFKGMPEQRVYQGPRK